jgi:hypothetical protein
MTEMAKLLGRPGISMEGLADWEAANELILANGWGDGLPVVPPTAERVEKMLAWCDRPWDVAVAPIPPRNGAATPLRIAANAVMAGCRPEHFPVLLAAIEAMCQPAVNLYGLQTTTHPCAPLVIMNGPIAREIGINCGHNAFGPGNQGNATLGRAVRLCLLNIGGAQPQVGDMATLGHPGKYAFWVAENEAANPWEPLHVERGFDASTSTITIVGADAPHNINDHESITALGILTMIAGAMATTGSNNVHYHGEPLLVMGPEHAAAVAREGYTKADVKRFLYEHAQVPLGRFSEENITRRMRLKFPERFAKAGLDAGVPLASCPEDFMIVVMGGAGKHSAHLPTFGVTRSVTWPITLQDGRHAASVQDFRRT